jgi:hypothetical protein
MFYNNTAARFLLFDPGIGEYDKLLNRNSKTDGWQLP